MKHLISRIGRLLGHRQEGQLHPDLELFDEGSGEVQLVHSPEQDRTLGLVNAGPPAKDEMSPGDMAHPDLQFDNYDPDIALQTAAVDVSGISEAPDDHATSPAKADSRETGLAPGPFPDTTESHVSGEPKPLEQVGLDQFVDHEFDGSLDDAWPDEMGETDFEVDDVGQIFPPFGRESDDYAVLVLATPIAEDFPDSQFDEAFEPEVDSETADWEDLHDLEFYEQNRDAPAIVALEETVQDARLEDYAARLVEHVQTVNSRNRIRLKNRFRAVLEEFPFAASHRAIANLMTLGATIEDIEEACALKCIWRDCPDLWSQRRFDRLQNAWVLESSRTRRNALTWILAAQLVREHGFTEASRRVVEDWLNDWQNLLLPSVRGDRPIGPKFYSYAAYLQNVPDTPRLRDAEHWYYQEPADHPISRELHVEAEDGLIVWRFEPKNSGHIFRLPDAK